MNKKLEKIENIVRDLKEEIKFWINNNILLYIKK